MSRKEAVSESKFPLVPAGNRLIQLKEKTETGIVLPSLEKISQCYEAGCNKPATQLVGMLLPRQWFYPGDTISLMPVVYASCKEHRTRLEHFQEEQFPKAPLLLVADTSEDSRRNVLEILDQIAEKTTFQLFFED